MPDPMKIVYIDIDKLKPYKGNTRKHEKKSIAGIKASIDRHGFRDPIGVWGKENLIVEGHGRYQAAREMGIKRLPCIRLDDMTDKERKAYAIEHNRTAELSEWIPEQLLEELNELAEGGIELPEMDFDFSELTQKQIEEEDIDFDIEEKDIRPYEKVHYLITVDLNEHDKIVDLIEQIKKTGAEVDDSLT